MVVCGLDSITARRWINSMLLSLLEYDDAGDLKQHTMIPIIDGGTEGASALRVRTQTPLEAASLPLRLG